MKKLPLIVAIFIVIDLLFVAAINLSQPVELSYNLSNGYLSSNLALIISFTFFLGAITAFALSYYSLKNIQSKLSKTSKKNEKVAIEAEENSDKVKLLEEKIKTLETALAGILADKNACHCEE
ncbi:MAG: hypothetical protein WC197_04975 [Candidatus Gastranaerophilaceae bacterium]|jgi:uncharacterized integral membrane protein